MNLIDLLSEAGGKGSVGQLGKSLNLDAEQTNTLIGAVAPALVKSMQKQATSGGGLDSLSRALETGGHQRYLEQPELVGSADAVDDGNNILGHLFGSKDVSRNVAARAASTTGLDTDTIKKALPMLAGLAMGALSKKSDSGRSVGSLLPGLLGGGSDDDDFGLDDVLSIAKKLF